MRQFLTRLFTPRPRPKVRVLAHEPRLRLESLEDRLVPYVAIPAGLGGVAPAILAPVVPGPAPAPYFPGGIAPAPIAALREIPSDVTESPRPRPSTHRGRSPHRTWP